MALFPYPKYLASSVDAGKLSLTIRGLLVGLIPTIIFLAKLKGVDLSEESITKVGDVLVQIVEAGTTVVAGSMFLWGVIRKLAVFFGIMKSK